MSVHQIESMLLNSEVRKELPKVKSINFTKIASLIDTKTKITLFLKSQKVKDYISVLAKKENLTVNDYICSIGVGRGARTYIDVRVASYIVSELSIKFKYHLINSLIISGRDILVECNDVPKTAVSKIYTML